MLTSNKNAMDEHYELVSKEELLKLRSENKELKEKLENIKIESKTSKSNKDFISEIVSTLHDESKKERDMISKDLTEIKEINKSTLDNLLEKTEKLDNRLENLVGTLKGLIENMGNLIEEMSGDNSQELNNFLHEMKEELNKKNNSTQDQEIFSKLEEIEHFMNNLKILLSQIKSSDLKNNQNNFPTN